MTNQVILLVTTVGEAEHLMNLLKPSNWETRSALTLVVWGMMMERLEVYIVE
jgi:hypothetical protein